MRASPQDLLAQHRLRPKHSWGQNFLGDQDVLWRIAEAAECGEGDVVVELGAGLGHLTEALLDSGARVVAVEKDRDMVNVLERLGWSGLTVVAANAEKVNFAEAAGTRPVIVAGNLPYHLSTALVFNVVEQRADVVRAAFTLQKEVVERLVAKPGGRDYGISSVLVQQNFQVEHAFDISRHAFHPVPNVESAVMVMRRLAKPKVDVKDAERFRRVVKAAFAHRRKTVLNSLRSEVEFALVAADALATAKVDPKRRAETMSLEEFGALERAMP